MTDTRKQKAEKASEMPIQHSVGGESADRIVGSPRWESSIKYERAIVSQTNIGTVSKATLGKLLRERFGAHMGISERIDTTEQEQLTKRCVVKSCAWIVNTSR